MAKRRKLAHQPTPQRPSGRPQPRDKKNQKQKQAKPPGAANKKKQHRQQQHEEPVIPFSRHDRILLVGEGDLSFAASIIEHHRCTNVTATVLEKDHAELVAKYPAVDTNIAIVNRRPGRRDANGTAGPDSQLDDKDGDEAVDDEHNDGGNYEDEGEDDDTEHKPRTVTNKLIYNVDATKLPPSITRTPHDRIIFNFPHVGGKSTDVNRQVRHNQELLVAFFRRALASPASPLAPGGSVVVTLFEGEPYTLWNIRDLGRHAGLQLERSFRFQAAAYPGYRHARTFGVVRNRKGEESGAGWKGEERAARSFVFMRKEELEGRASKKRKRGGDDSSSDEDDE